MEDKERVLESELKGVTLRVYWHVLEVDNKENIGVRQIQRERPAVLRAKSCSRLPLAANSKSLVR